MTKISDKKRNELKEFLILNESSKRVKIIKDTDDFIKLLTKELKIFKKEKPYKSRSYLRPIKEPYIYFVKKNGKYIEIKETLKRHLFIAINQMELGLTNAQIRDMSKNIEYLIKEIQ